MNGVEAKKKTIFTGLVLNMVLIDGCFRWELKVDLHSTLRGPFIMHTEWLRVE